MDLTCGMHCTSTLSSHAGELSRDTELLSVCLSGGRRNVPLHESPRMKWENGAGPGPHPKIFAILGPLSVENGPGRDRTTLHYNEWDDDNPVKFPYPSLAQVAVNLSNLLLSRDRPKKLRACTAVFRVPCHQNIIYFVQKIGWLFSPLPHSAKSMYCLLVNLGHSVWKSI